MRKMLGGNGFPNGPGRAGISQVATEGELVRMWSPPGQLGRIGGPCSMCWSAGPHTGWPGAGWSPPDQMGEAKAQGRSPVHHLHGPILSESLARLCLPEPAMCSGLVLLEHTPRRCPPTPKNHKKKKKKKKKLLFPALHGPWPPSHNFSSIIPSSSSMSSALYSLYMRHKNVYHMICGL
jgi:hypothetical protein